jgi:DNA-binding NarL/FixJ family response regulator
MIEDVAVADVMQLIRLGGHSGTLTVNDGNEEGFIGFERGRIVSAWNPRSRRLGELLVAAGAIDEATLLRGLEAQNTERPRRNIGQVLVRVGGTTPEAIRDVMTAEIERVVGEILSWKSGTFDFAIDDLTPVVEVTQFTGAPKVDLDTQTVLMEALQHADDPRPSRETLTVKAESEPAAAMAESNSSALDLGEVDGVGDLAALGMPPTDEHPRSELEGPVAREPTPAPESERPRYQLISPDTELLARVGELLGESGDRVSAVSLRDAGTSLLGESPPIVVVDLRYQVHGLSTLAALCRSRPRAAVIALFEGRAPLREMYKSGVLSVTSPKPETVVACLRSAARQRKYMAREEAITEGVRASFSRLRRIIADLRSGLLGTSVSSNLMAAVAESLDRGVLFVPHLDRLVAIGAFGKTSWGAPLAKTTQGLILNVGKSGILKECLHDSRSRRLPYDDANFPQAFLEAVDRPRTGQCAILPVPGSERVIATIYLDNGTRDRTIGDIEIFELASFQLGLALENEFLRRSSAKPDATSTLLATRKAG